MELPLQRNVLNVNFKEVFNMCFNPCFNGTTSATHPSKCYGSMQEEVSILVLMELPLQQKLSDSAFRFSYVFQSLF